MEAPFTVAGEKPWPPPLNEIKSNLMMFKCKMFQIASVCLFSLLLNILLCQKCHIQSFWLCLCIGYFPTCVSLLHVCFWIDNIMIINKSKWNDLSVLSCKGGYEAYTKWKYDWTIHSGQKEASIKVYVSEMIMPFWVQCTLCSKWREFPEKELTPAVIKSWKCSAPSCIITSNNKVKSKYSI